MLTYKYFVKLLNKITLKKEKNNHLLCNNF